MKQAAFSRSHWHRAMLCVQLVWAVLAVAAAAARCVDSRFAWHSVHVAGLGLIGSAILVWTWHFADALTRRRESQRDQLVRLGMYSAGVLVLGIAMAGTGRGAAIVAICGACTIAAMVLWHLVALKRALRGSFLSPAAVTLRFHVVGSMFLVIGAVAGLVAGINASSRGDALALWSWLYHAHDALVVAHMASVIFGFVGMTILGTLVTFGPTLARARMHPEAVSRAGRALYALTACVVVMVGGALANVTAVVAVATLAWVVISVIAVVMPVGRSWIRSMASLSDAGFVGAGVAWILGGALIWAWHLALAHDVGASRSSALVTSAALLGIGAVQVVVGSLTYLVPVVLGGGPARVRRTLEWLAPSGGTRFILLNAMACVALTSDGSFRVIALGMAVASGGVSLVMLAIAAVRQLRDVPEIVIGRESRAPESSGGVARSMPCTHAALGAALTACALAVVGIWGSPQGINSQSEAAVTKVSVRVDGMAFVPSTIEVPAGNRLVVELTNSGDQRHDLTFPNGATTGAVAVDSTVSVDAGVITSDIEAWCSLVGHKQAGMTLKVIAIGSGDAAAAQAGGSAHLGHTDSANSATQSFLMPTTAELAATSANMRVFDPVLAPASTETTHRLTLEAREVTREVAPGRIQTLWTFNGTSPGPTLRGKIGDRFIVTVTNVTQMGHSIDFHAGDVSPDSVMKTIAPGESLTYEFTAKRSGIWLYHCATAPMSVHIASGMFGAVVIDPEDMQPVDREYLLIQSEQYWDSDPSIPANAHAVSSVKPSIVTFNGYPYQYVHSPLQVRTGERVRLWVLSAGPNLDLAFHVVGTQFDTTWYEGSYRIRRGCDGSGLTQGSCDPFAAGNGSVGSAGSQGLDVAVAQGGFVEFVAPAPGTYNAVNHAMAYAEKGAKASIVVKD